LITQRQLSQLCVKVLSAAHQGETAIIAPARHSKELRVAEESGVSAESVLQTQKLLPRRLPPSLGNGLSGGRSTVARAAFREAEGSRKRRDTAKLEDWCTALRVAKDHQREWISATTVASALTVGTLASTQRPSADI
jgi:hypothetical protein